MPTPKKDSSINILPVILPNLRKAFCKLFAESVNHWSCEHRCCSHVSVHRVLTAKLDPTGSPLLYTLDGQWSQYLGRKWSKLWCTWSTHKCSSFFRIDISSTFIHLENKRWIWSTWRSTTPCKTTTSGLRAKRMVKRYHWVTCRLAAFDRETDQYKHDFNLFFLLNMNENKRCFEVVFSSAKFSSHKLTMTKKPSWTKRHLTFPELWSIGIHKFPRLRTISLRVALHFAYQSMPQKPHRHLVTWQEGPCN